MGEALPEQRAQTDTPLDNEIDIETEVAHSVEHIRRAWNNILCEHHHNDVTDDYNADDHAHCNDGIITVLMIAMGNINSY